MSGPDGSASGRLNSTSTLPRATSSHTTVRPSTTTPSSVDSGQAACLRAAFPQRHPDQPPARPEPVPPLRQRAVHARGGDLEDVRGAAHGIGVVETLRQQLRDRGDRVHRDAADGVVRQVHDHADDPPPSGALHRHVLQHQPGRPGRVARQAAHGVRHRHVASSRRTCR